MLIKRYVINEKILKFITHLIVLNLFCSVTKAQNYIGITPMHKFFQKHADSTYIISAANQHNPEFKILSKVGDTISAYNYKSKTKLSPKLREIPKAFRDGFLKNNGNLIYTVPVDINVFFEPKHISPDSLKQFWATASKLKMWDVPDDKKDGEGCDVKKNSDAISDGGQIYLHLITKNSIKELFFYAPDYYNEKCPGRAGSKAVLNLNKLFSQYFNKN